VVKAPVRIWVPLLFFLRLIVLIQGASALIGPEGMTDLIYILAGAAKIRRERSASLGVPLSDASSAERTDDGTGKEDQR
jgi:hypothetical protein